VTTSSTSTVRNLRFRIASRGQRTTLGKVLEKQRLLIIIEKETSPQIQSVPSAESPVGRLTVSLACDAVGVDSLYTPLAWNNFPRRSRFADLAASNPYFCHRLLFPSLEYRSHKSTLLGSYKGREIQHTHMDQGRAGKALPYQMTGAPQGSRTRNVVEVETGRMDTRSGRGIGRRTRSGRRSPKKSLSRSTMATAPSGKDSSGRSPSASTLQEKSFYNLP